MTSNTTRRASQARHTSMATSIFTLLRTRRNALCVMVALVLAAAVFAHADSAPSQATTPSGVPATVGTTDCAGFAQSVTAWTDAQDAYLTHAATANTDPYGLDADHDGYACESLAMSTAADNEPDCQHAWFGSWLPMVSKDCSARNQFRYVAHLTSRKDPAAIRGALLDVYGSYVVNTDPHGPNASLLRDAYACASTDAPATMLTFIRTREVRDEAVRAFAQMAGLGGRAVRVAGLGTTNPAAAYVKALTIYLTMAGKAMEGASGVALSARAAFDLGAIATDDCQP